MVELKGKKALVVGLGRTGVPAALRLMRLGAAVTVTDRNPAEKLKDDLAKLPVVVSREIGSHERVINEEFDLVVTSPGVPWESPLLAAMRASGAEVISEIELAFRLAKRDWVAITGTNGKSTTTALVGAMMNESKLESVVCGNIGNAVIGEDAVFERDVRVVAEISSFQLEGVTEFKPRVSAILNITQDHLDRHGTMEEYIRLKCRVFDLQRGNDVCVLNLDDEEAAKLVERAPCRVFPFSAQRVLKEGVFANNGRIVIVHNSESWSVGDAKDLKIVGRANLENALAACAIAFSAGADVAAITRALFRFEALPHRLELVAETAGVKYVNDSKGTNVGSTLKALDGMDGHVVVILGGLDKGSDYAPLADLVKRKKASVILIGEAADKIGAALAGYADVVRAASMEESVRIAAARACRGDTVLLSPACASFDMFRDYLDRGDKFRQAVKNLSANGGANAQKA
ncbi:MAG: UDP-N-acetylmuramoyl-L-alanine--D-glutamate ligase [Nitrospinae bacterium]|nr:UDP-N-acetylmuramoyl-L-alanine--D-glutamate ligase [Nitrospinota bacterium]